jgi:hypothetical protein
LHNSLNPAKSDEKGFETFLFPFKIDGKNTANRLTHHQNPPAGLPMRQKDL